MLRQRRRAMGEKTFTMATLVPLPSVQTSWSPSRQVVGHFLKLLDAKDRVVYLDTTDFHGLRHVILLPFMGCDICFYFLIMVTDEF